MVNICIFTLYFD